MSSTFSKPKNDLQTPLLDAALDYAKQGLPVFPCHHPIDSNSGLVCSCGNIKCDRRAKHPRTEHGNKDATTDENTIRGWWSRWPTSNIGIATGSASGLDVVDIDNEQADSKVKELIPNISRAPLAQTGRGHQLAFAHVPDSGLTVHSALGDIKGLDFRGDGGYIIAAPSRHINGKYYTWIRPLNGNLPPLPQAFIEFAAAWVNRKNGFKEGFDSSPIWEGVPEGNRDESIFKYACQLRALRTPEDVARDLVCAAAARCRPPFDDWQAKVDQAWKYPAGAQRVDSENPADAEWPEPGPIQAPLYPVPAFDPDALLPDALRGWVMDEAGRMPCPPDFVAATAIVVLGAVIGARCAVKPKSKDDWIVVPNLWGAVVGLPSAMKTPGINAGAKPMDKLIAKAFEAHAAGLSEFEAETISFDAKTDAIAAEIKTAARAKKDPSNGSNGSTLTSLFQTFKEHKAKPPSPPVLRRYKTNDCTVEKLGELLRDNPHGLLVQRDELVGLIASWDKEGREGDRAFFLEGWNGNQGFDTDRIGRGSILIPNLCVSVFGGIQPDKLTRYLEQASNALANDGMLQRFQVLVYPDHQPWEWRDSYPIKDARARAFAVFETLADFDPLHWGAVPADDFIKFPHFRFNDDAQEIFIEWSSDLHKIRIPAEDHPLIQQHLTKFAKLFPALALILHLTDCAATGQRGSITQDAALRAGAWCDYLEKHARRCYALLLDDGLRSAHALADKIGLGKLKDGFTARELRRNQWRYLTTDDAVQAALDWLEDKSWLRSIEVGGDGPGKGRRTWQYVINPKVALAAKNGGRQ